MLEKPGPEVKDKFMSAWQPRSASSTIMHYPLCRFVYKDQKTKIISFLFGHFSPFFLQKNTHSDITWLSILYLKSLFVIIPNNYANYQQQQKTALKICCIKTNFFQQQKIAVLLIDNATLKSIMI